MKTVDAAFVTEAVTSTFENLAFMEALPDHAESFKTAGTLSASVDCLEPRTGGMTLHIPRKLAEEFASNSLGDPSITDELIQDVLGETCNVIAGRIGSKNEGTLLLGPPRFEFEAPAMRADSVNYYFQSGEQCFAISIW